MSTTPEPELNVEAELALYRVIDKVRHRKHASYPDEAIAELLALIQQVSDQRVRGFSELLKAYSHYVGHENTLVVTHSDIDQTLADYLSHKEARDDTDL